MTQGCIIAVVVAALALCRRNHQRGVAVTRFEAFRTKMKVLFLVLAVCSLCSKAIVHACRHFNPPQPPIIGP
ncbi:hypothetical protein CQ12_30785 [Bradyrhizobium jicamae]|uniref:Uncharacterized protein n=1 Tax=Bradyrhizobium jicamae TaxID=280332 RepID=A0A0R3KKM4_9BRAD|nr:hypothetical protein CQ12_30785 [Bradyrhizobium jicamae]